LIGDARFASRNDVASGLLSSVSGGYPRSTLVNQNNPNQGGQQNQQGGQGGQQQGGQPNQKPGQQTQNPGQGGQQGGQNDKPGQQSPQK